MGEDPHFDAVRTIYNVQEQLLDVSGPLTCLWSDLSTPEAEVSVEQVLLLLQRPHKPQAFNKGPKWHQQRPRNP